MITSVLSRFSVGVVLLVALVVRLVVLLIHHEVYPLPQGGADAVGFERAAWILSQTGREDVSAYLFSGGRFLTFLGSFVYDVTGRAPYALGLIMVLLGTALVYVVYQAALELWEDRGTAVLVAWACALFPQLILHSALFLRETPVAFCLGAAGLSAVRLLKRHSLPQVGWFAAWIFLGTLFHSAVIVAAPAFLLGMLLARQRGSRRRLAFYAVNMAAAVTLVGGIVWVNETGYGLGKFGGSFDEAVSTFEAQEARAPHGAAAFPEWMRLQGGLSEAWKIPVRYGTFLFSPLVPLMVRAPRHALGVLDAALYLLLFWLILRNWRLMGTDRAAGVLLVVMLSLFLVYSLGVSNFGTAIRHRAKIAPLLLVLAAGLPALKRRRGLGDSRLPGYP